MEEFRNHDAGLSEGERKKLLEEAEERFSGR
jgi:hypothetical protein